MKALQFLADPARFEGRRQHAFEHCFDLLHVDFR